MLYTARERNNPYDKYAVVVEKGQISVGHVPHGINKTVTFCMKHGSILTCKVKAVNTETVQNVFPLTAEGALI